MGKNPNCRGSVLFEFTAERVRFGSGSLQLCGFYPYHRETARQLRACVGLTLHLPCYSVSDAKRHIWWRHGSCQTLCNCAMFVTVSLYVYSLFRWTWCRHLVVCTASSTTTSKSASHSTDDASSTHSGQGNTNVHRSSRLQMQTCITIYLEVITRLFSYRPVYQGRASIISPRR